MDDIFLEISKALTGFTDLSIKAANIYLKQLINNDRDGITQLLNHYREKSRVQADQPVKIIEAIYADSIFLKKVCQEIIAIWYNASIINNGVTTWQAPPEYYFDALIWKAIEAHPPAVSGGYFGYWRYAPEN